MLLSWFATAAALLLGAWLIPGGVFVEGVFSALMAAAVLGFVNMTIKPILFILTLPITLITLGLFTFVINAMMLGLVSWMLPGFEVRSLMSGIGLAIIIAIVHALAVHVFGDKRRGRRLREFDR
jgi:putative membrane protein